MFCNNCGEKGHVFKSCPCPIISCGLLLIRGDKEPLTLPMEDTSKAEIIMVRRKDSMSFMEFVRGKYELNDSGYLHRLIENMSVDEQRKIVELPFAILWTQLWGNSRDTHSPEFYDAKEKFEALDRTRIVMEHRSKWPEPEWGFPKGRRMRGESDVECAIREFFEETNIPRDAYTLCKNLSFTEVFTGTNDIKYKHVYFIGLLSDSHKFDLSQKLTNVQKREISAVEWKSLSECKSITRPHYTRRRQIIGELESALQTFETLANKAIE